MTFKDSETTGTTESITNFFKPLVNYECKVHIMPGNISGLLPNEYIITKHILACQLFFKCKAFSNVCIILLNLGP